MYEAKLAREAERMQRIYTRLSGGSQCIGLRHVINKAGDWSRVCREHLQLIYDERLSTIGH